MSFFRFAGPETILLAVCFFLSIGCPVLAQEVHSQKDVQFVGRPRIALVLGGGGSRGAAHIGVLRVLEEEGIRFDLVVGNSIGAIIGGLYCAGTPLTEIEAIMKDQTLSEVYLPRFIWARILFIPLRPLVYAFRETPCAGLASGKKMHKFLEKQIPENKRLIEKLDIPFEAVALNLNDGTVRSFDHGDLVQSMIASSTIPGLFKPVKIDSEYYVDGGIGANVPTFKARQSGADFIIAVSADNKLTHIQSSKLSSYKFLGRRILDAAFVAMDKRLREEANIVIAPRLIGATMMDDDLERIEDSISAGEVAARAALPEIKDALARLEASHHDKEH
ncbi:MAG: patatin-like phospholipase family protein [Candidatus Melainabacteria bacterium]|nr:patatin-like phospholipase family protein [Candidatus Melainabacteria bacterium]